MLGRGFVAVRLIFDGGSALTKKLRPSSSTTLAMCPLPFCANNGAKNDAEKIAQRTSVVRMSPVVIAVRFIIRLLPRLGRVRAFRKANNNLGTYTTAWTVFNTSTKPSMSRRY